MKCPQCQHVAAEVNAKFCSECGVKLPQHSGQPQQKPSVPVEQETASLVTQTNASAKQNKVETKGNLKKKQSKKQASSLTSSGTDSKVQTEQEQLQQSSSPKEDPSTTRDSQGEETVRKDDPPPKIITPAKQHIPASDRLTIYFHAVLSKDFKFNPDTDRIFLRAGSGIGSWEYNTAELTVSWDLGEHGFFVEGKLMTTKKEAASVSIPYKYLVYKHKKEKYEYEHIYKLDSKETVNRCLFVMPHLLNEEGEWHQYDDIICATPSNSVSSKSLALIWPAQKKSIIEGREIAGRIMLETVFDLLRSWSEINLKSFLTQLNQFHQVYANPFVYENTQQKWYSLDNGEKEVNLLLRQVVLEGVTPQLGKDSSGRSTFIQDPFKAAVIVLYIWNKYRIRLDNGELSRLCTALCLPDLPKDDFISYWTDFVMSFSHIKNLPEMVLALVGYVKAEGMPHWILAVPLLHFLRGSSVPFEPVRRIITTRSELSWAGLEGLKSNSNASMSSQDRRAMIYVMTTHKHLFEVDALLARSWIWAVTVEELVECCCIVPIGLLDILQAFYLKGPADVDYYTCIHVSDVLSHIQKTLVEQQYSLQSEDYGRACLATAIELLEKICRAVKSSYRNEFTKIPVACMNMVALVFNLFLSSQSQEVTEVGGAKINEKDGELLGGAMHIMRKWITQTFRDRLTTSNMYMRASLTPEIEMWNNIISLSFKNEEVTKEWRQLFTTDFEGKFEKESPLNQIEIYCFGIEEIRSSYPHVANSIEKCALQAFTSICQAKAEAKLFEKIKINWKFGKLVSAIIEKSWPRDAGGHYQEGEEAILQHMLSWTAATHIFHLQDGDEKLMDKLSDEARERLAAASSAFTSISHKVLTGAIEIKLLNQILKNENQRTFMELLKIDCLSDSEKCKDSSAMRRLLQWRREEVKEVYRKRELVECLITMSHNLQEHIKVDIDNLEERQQINIEVMTLNQFMEVHQFDSPPTDMTGIVTFFKLDQNTEEMAKVLHMLKDSIIFGMCWENQAKEISGRLERYNDDEDEYDEEFMDADEESELQQVATLPVIYSEIYQPSYNKYQLIYSELKSGTLKLKEVDVIFGVYKGKYEELREELEIMCRTDRSEDRHWIQRRVGQIEQYHEIHLAVESALVIKKVIQTLHLQGDFKVLEMLLEVADVNFNNVNLDRIDNNLMQAKKDMVEITKPRLLCLQELGERKNFVTWVKEALEDINELKVFVDLASISAGENDLDVDRVACFHDAVLGYSSMLYELKPDSGFDILKETLKKLWKALDSDPNLPKKLRDTARHLEWLKTVKDSHGSVELSSLSLASAINKKGIYVISAQNQKKLSLETALKLNIPEEHGEGQEMHSYSLEELRELQNKLMLMSGKGEQGQGEVEHFVEAEAKHFEKIKINWTFGKLVSAIIEKSWPRDAGGHYQEGEEAILQHMLSWTAATHIFHLQDGDEKLMDNLSDEARERLAAASSAFTSISHKVLTGAIEIKLLNQILKTQNQRTFLELLKIDCLSDSEKCKDSSAMRRLLQWRKDEVKEVYRKRELVECLITMSRKLQEHIKVDIDNLEERQQINIEVMTLNQFMEVHQFDSPPTDMTGIVTFFKLDQNTEEMAKVLRMLKDSIIFAMCWENQAKEISGRLARYNDDEDEYDEEFMDADEESELQQVATLPVIYSEIYQPSYNKYQLIYSELKSGALKLGEVDVIFGVYKGKYEELREELEIMCRTDRSEERHWIQMRVGQIEQYHEIHLAVKSALVIKKVIQTLHLQGDFKVLEMLLEVADVNFKNESLDRIDNNLMQAKKDMVEITKPRLLCLQELSERKNFVTWVKEALEDINELKVFVDLASISAGENDLDVDRVACFHDAVLGYSSMLYELKPDSGFDILKETLKKLWKALDSDPNLPKKLRDTARHLEWLKTVKDSLGSVELSSLSLASAINKKGLYVISAQNQKKLSLETALKLKIPEEHEEGKEMRSYSLEELRELQNKLMLMSGKGEQGQGEVEHFVEAKAEAKLFEKIKINWKFGKLVSAIIEKSWPRDAGGHYQEGEEAILQHMLSWTAATHIFHLQDGDEKLMDKLSDEARERLAAASSAFTSISHRVLTGAIEIKLLNQILKNENQRTFMELLKIDCLSDSEKCKDSSAMRRLLQWRKDEVKEVYRKRELVECLITMSRKLQEHIKVDIDNLEERQQINIEVMTLNQFMEVHQFDSPPTDMTGIVTFFKLDQNTEEMAKVLHMLKDSIIFAMCWENQAKEISGRLARYNDDEDEYDEEFMDADEESELQQVATLPVIYSEIYQPSYNKYQLIYSELKSGALKLGEVDVIFGVYKGKYEELREELEIMCRTDRSEERHWIQMRVGQIEQYHEIHLAVESALVIKKVIQTLHLQGDFKVLEMLLEVADVNFKNESLDRIDNNLMQAKKDMVEITKPRLLCLQELSERKNFVTWVKEALEDINELKVFVDLASISAGENDLDVDRVACFHDAVLGYSSMLYELKPDSGFDILKETLKKLWKALDSDPNLPKKLRDTARRLEWLKTVKDSLGSVELSSLSLASAINKKGIYVISAQNQKKLSLETALKLKIPEEHEEGQEMRSYSLEELRELQNKLMLISGKGEQGQGEVEHFVKVFAGIQRLTVAFVDLYAAGNPLFRHWEANINCSAVNGDDMAGIIMDFNLNSAVGEIVLVGDVLEQLLELCRKMEQCLDFWKAFVVQQRFEHYYLNYYTAEQIVYLCDRLTQRKMKELDNQTLMMLSFIKPNCGVHDLRQTWHKLQYELLTQAPQQNKDIDFQTFVETTNSMEEDPTFDEEGADLLSLVERASGSQKLDVVWNAYMRDMQSFFPDSLGVHTLGRLLEMLANQEEYDEDDEEEVLMLSERKENCILRILPNGLVSGRPNLVICPRPEVLKSCISVYMSSGHELLPTYDEVLLCTAATPYEQVELFFRRCLTAGYRGEKIYTLLYAEDLAYEVSYRVEQLFQRLEKQCSKPYRLVIICSADREHAYIPSAFSQYPLHMVPLESLQKIQSYLSWHYTVPSELASAAAVFRDRMFVRAVTSKRAGVGKSLYIQRLYEKLRKSTKRPCHLKCIRLIEPSVDENIILQSLLSTLQKKELTIFHFDITSSVRKGLHEFLFKLLVLGYLMDSEGRMWKCSNTSLYAVEILQSMENVSRTGKRVNAHAQFAFLDVFPKVFCRSPKEVLELEMETADSSMKDDDPLMDDQEFRSEAYQRPYQYLTRFHNGISLDTFMYTGVEGNHVQCLQMFFVYCGIVDPSWAELRNFAWFLNLQLRDCETSVFCQMDFVGDTLHGFKNFVVDFMILMAKDFATPSLSISDQSPGRRLVDLAGATEADLAPFRIRKRWESEPHPYIFFNDDHISMTFIGFHLKVNEQNSVDAIDPLKKTVIKQNVMSQELYEGLKLQRVPFNIDFDQLPRGEKIERLCNVLGIQWPTDPDETYELTTDNILKMLAIHMRFRCGIPVIIMGETGCGKTRLVKFLCELRRSGAPTENMKLVKVHGGTTSDMIYAKVREADDIALLNKQEFSFDSILFFDEANTTEAVSSIKEILCDGTVKGEPLTRNTGLQIIAACNPYRKHSDEMIQRLESAGLGYRVRAEETDDKLGSIPLRQLVYRVQALPPSMIPLVWDFGQLNDCTEKMYIQQIVQRVVDTNAISPQYIEMITNVLSASQKYMRMRKDECSFVSLRDVERCMQAFVWFYKNHIMLLAELRMFLDETRNAERTGKMQRSTESRDPVVWSLVMAVGVCYHACLENKDGYRKKICKHLPNTHIPQKVAQEILLMQELLLSGFPLGDTIARNNALKENVFMMVICIELRIPLFLVGKPGSSKSLSKTLVADAMQGQAAHSELYKKLKQIHMVSFQCSPHSTPDGIINTFKQCARFQEGKNLKEYISVVVLDEIGLAEDSPKMPLKTLHPLLEEGCIDDEPLPHKKVGFIGISNWALDPAKMNRGIFVSRGDPDEKELIESAKGICFSDKMVLEKVRGYFQPFARAYLNVCRKQGKGFFGLRDYYSLIKMVFAIAKVSAHEPSPERLVEAVLRNFSGKDNVNAVEVFISRLCIRPNMESISAIELVRQNISAIGQDDECRYLLVLTKNYAALQILQQTFFSEQRQPEIIFGSSFPKDQEYTQICRNINRVKICMETGQTVVLLNLQNLYESLYDALNQYYVCLGGQKYVDLGLGTHRVKCRVHKDFRLIVIEEKEVVYKQFPIPLINRLEKHYLDINTVLKSDQKGLVCELEKWVGRFVTLRSQQSMVAQSHEYLPPDVFIGYHSDTCASVVLQVTEKLKEKSEGSEEHGRILDEAKLILLDCATPDSVVRLDCTFLPRSETEQLARVYFERQKHSSLADFIISHTQQEEWCYASFTEVTTFSRLLTASDTGLLQEAASNIELLSLQQFDTEHSFLKKIRYFLDTTSGCRILIIQTDFSEGSQSANLIASAKYSAMNEISKSRDEEMRGKVFVYFITKLPRMEGGTSYVGFHGGLWKSVHIDDLRRSKDIISDIKALRGATISQLFEDKVEEHNGVEMEDMYSATEEQEMEWSEHTDTSEAVLDTTALVRSCVQSAVGMLRDQGEGGARSTRRVEILLMLLADNEELKAAFLTALKRRLHTLLVTYDAKSFSSKNWVISEASNVDALQEGGTFRHALWKRVQAVVTPLLAQLVAIADRDYNLDLLLDHNSGEPVRKLWLDIFRDEKLLEVPFASVDRNSESKTIPVQSDITQYLGVGCSMPFSWRMRDFLQELWVHTQQHEGHTLRQFEEFFWNTPLGRYMADAGEEMQKEFFQRYLQDFVSMTMKVTSGEELQLLCTALTCCVNELRIREDMVEGEVISLPWVHAAYQTFKNRLQNLSRMVAMEPRVATALQGNEGSREGPEMVLDVFAGLACVELLEPRGLDSDGQRLAWLRQVKRLQGPIVLVCSEESCRSYGERSQEWARAIRRQWRKIFSLSLFVEHMLVGIEGVEEKLHPLLLEHTRALGRILETDSDLKREAPFLAVIGILKACMDGANDRIFKFGRQPCPVCMGDPQDPLSLPCDHIYCLACIRQWLIPGQMYCPLCKQEVPDDYNLTASEDIRRRIDMYAQFRKRCNAFFIDLVSTVCFKDNAPPSSEVIQQLLSFLMVPVESVHIIRARHQVFTKALSPFDDSVDKNPVVRSVILKLLLKYSFSEVKGYLQKHLSDVEQSNILDKADKSELYSLYINCLQDSMLERTQCRTLAERTAYLKDEENFLQHFLGSGGVTACKSSIKHLQRIARVRLCLDMAARLLTDKLTNPGPREATQYGVRPFLRSVSDLCVQSRNDWYRVYLIRKMCSQQGVEFVQKLQTMAEFKWLFPAEILQGQESGQMDHFLVWGEDYRTIREAVAKATMNGGTQGIEEACERCGGTPAKKRVLLLLALFREVTTLYRPSNHSLHPKPELLHALEEFIQDSRVLVGQEVQAFALALVHNQLGALGVTANRPGVEHGLVELTVHLAAVLTSGNHGRLAPLRLLALSPARMQEAFLPTMPEDMLAVARAALGNLTWYYCPNGHPCTVGECGQPMEVKRCLDCNAQIGGSNHRAVQGFNQIRVQADRTQKGHILGDPGRRDMPDMLDTKSLSPAPFTLLRLLTHMSMLIGASEHPQVIAQIIKYPVQDPGLFLIGHLLKDMEQLGRTLGKGADDTVSVAHLMVLSLLEPNLPTQWPVPNDNVLSTKEGRNAWETGFASDIIVPQLKNLEPQLTVASALIRTDSRVSSSPVMRVVFGDPGLILATLPRDSLVHSGVVWSCRERVSLQGLAHVVEQNDGRDTLPVLWRFLQKEPELRLVRFLPEILDLQKDLVKKFQNAMDTSRTIQEFIQGLKAASLKSWYETRIKTFLKTWNQLRQSLATKGELKIPAELCQTDLDLGSDLQVLLPRRQGQGLCATALVSYLIALHNEQVRTVDKHTGEETSYTVSPADLSDLHVIRYEPERDLLPLVLSHCQYSMERGRETISQYDLPKIQQQLLTRFLQGKPLISLEGIPTLVNRHDRNYVNIFKDVKEKVGQEALPALTLAALAGELQAYSDVCEALAVVEVALGFLAMTSEDPSMQLVCYLKDILQMGDQTAPHILKALSRCSLKHCAALWQLLASLKSENMLRLKRDPFVGVSGDYKEPLSEEERGLLVGFLSKGSVDTCMLEMHEFLLLHLKGGQAPETYRPSWGLKETLESYIERKDVDVPPDVELLPDQILLSKFVEAWKFIAAFRLDRNRR